MTRWITVEKIRTVPVHGKPLVQYVIRYEFREVVVPDARTDHG